MPALIHALFDFSILSGAADDKPYAGGLAAIVVYPLVAVVLLARRHRIEPSSAKPRPASNAGP